MTNESPNEASQKTAKEKGTVAIETPSSDSTEAPPLPISEDELVKHVKDKDTAPVSIITRTANSLNLYRCA